MAALCSRLVKINWQVTQGVKVTQGLNAHHMFGESPGAGVWRGLGCEGTGCQRGNPKGLLSLELESRSILSYAFVLFWWDSGNRLPKPTHAATESRAKGSVCCFLE